MLLYPFEYWKTDEGGGEDEDVSDTLCRIILWTCFSLLPRNLSLYFSARSS